MISYFDRDGIAITQEQWVDLFADREYSTIGKWEGEGGISVSTVWLGLNARYGQGDPIIFETMIFGGGKLDQEGTRYTTLGDAAEGHLRTVSDILEGRPVWFTVDEVFL